MSHGFFTGPKYEVSFDEPMANSSMFVLPSVPCRRRRTRDHRRVVGADEIASIFEPQVVRQPSAQKMSFCAIGMPVSGPPLPRASGRRRARAWPGSSRRRR